MQTRLAQLREQVGPTGKNLWDVLSRDRFPAQSSKPEHVSAITDRVITRLRFWVRDLTDRHGTE